MKNYFFLILINSIFYITSCISQENPPIIDIPDQSNYTTELIVDGIDIPWGMDFINEEELLVTDKKGTLYHVLRGVKTEVSGLPKIYVRGQGGLLDVALHPNFKSNGIVYLAISVNIEGDEGGNTALYRGTYEEFKIKNIELLYKAVPNTKKGQHWGSRIVFDDEGHLFFGVGDRGNRDVNPQDLKKDGGKIYRLNLINSCTGYKSSNLIATISDEGINNVAIFSSITHLGSNPAMLGFILRPKTVPRDTYRNIKYKKKFSVNHVHYSQIRDAHHTSAKYTSEISEFEKTELTEEYKFDKDTTLAILAGFSFNKRVLIQGYHGTGKSTHIEPVSYTHLTLPTNREV